MKVKELFCRLDGTQVVREAEVPDELFVDGSAAPGQDGAAAQTAEN